MGQTAELMKYTKGHTKQGGRAKGTPNKLTKQARQTIYDILGEGKERFTKYLEELGLQDYGEVYIKLLGMVANTKSNNEKVA